MSDTKPCRCPVRPHGPSLASGSAWETQRLREWQEQHGHHDYAKAQSRMAVEMLAPQPVEGAYIASEVKAADGANGSSVAPDPPRDMATATDIRPGDEFDLTPTSPDGERMSPVHVSVAQDGNITVTRKE